MKQPGVPQSEIPQSEIPQSEGQTLVGEVNKALVESGISEDLLKTVQEDWEASFNGFSSEIDPDDPYAQPELLARTVSHYLSPEAVSPTVLPGKATEGELPTQVVPDSEISEFEDLPVSVQNLITELDLALVGQQVAALEVEPRDQPGIVGNVLNMRKTLRERGEEAMLRAYVGLTTSPRFEKLQRVLPLGVAMLYAAKFLTSGDGGPLVQASAAELFGGAVATGITASLVARKGEVVEENVPSEQELEAFYERNEEFVARVHHEFGTTQRMIFLGFEDQAELLTLQVAQGDTILHELRELASAVDGLRVDRDADQQAGREAQERQAGELTHNLPERNPNFTGRSEVMDELLQRVTQPQSGRPLLHVLTGPGGIGKTEIAMEMAHQLVQRVDQGGASLNNILVVECGDSALDLQRSYADLAYILNLPGKTMADEKARAAKVRDYLSANPGWLLIFDDALDQRSIKNYLPTIGGHVVCTSRSQKWPEKSRLNVDALAEPEVREFLDKRLGENVSVEDKGRLAEILAGYPLALEQAVAVLTKTGVTAEEFVDALESADSTGRKAIAQIQEDLASEGRYEQTVGSVVQLALQELGKDSEAAVKLIEAISLLAPAEIPDAVVDQLVKEMPEVFGGDFVTDQALLQLQQRSLVSPSPPSIHAVLQKAVEDSVDPKVREKYIGALLKAVKEGNPFDIDDPDTWAHASVFIPHAEKVTFSADQGNIFSWDSAVLHQQVGEIFQVQSNYSSAKRHFVRALDIISDVGVLASPADEAILILNIAETASLQGRYSEAESYSKTAIQAAYRIYGADSVEMVPYYLNLGDIRFRSGDIRRAREMATRAIQIVEPNPFQPLANDKDKYRGASWAALGVVLFEEGDFLGAQDAFKKTFDAVKGFGYGNPLVIDALQNYATVLVQLAILQKDQGRKDELLNSAERMLSFAVQNAEATYGPNGQMVVRPLNAHVTALLEIGNYRAAKIQIDRAARISLLSGLEQQDLIAKILVNQGHISISKNDISEGRRLFFLAKKRLEDFGYSKDHPLVVKINQLYEKTKVKLVTQR